MPVGGGLLVDRAAEVEVTQDRRGTEVEVLEDELLDPLQREVLGAEALDEYRERVRDADRVGDLDLAAVGESRGDPA